MDDEQTTAAKQTPGQPLRTGVRLWLADAWVCILASTTAALLSVDGSPVSSEAFAASAHLAVMGVICWMHVVVLPDMLRPRRWSPRECAGAMWGLCLSPAVAVLAFLLATLIAAILGAFAILAIEAVHHVGGARNAASEMSLLGMQSLMLPLAVSASAIGAALTACGMTVYGRYALPDREFRRSLKRNVMGAGAFGLLLLPCDQADALLGNFGLLTALAPLPWIWLASHGRRPGGETGGETGAIVTL